MAVQWIEALAWVLLLAWPTSSWDAAAYVFGFKLILFMLSIGTILVWLIVLPPAARWRWRRGRVRGKC